MKTTFELFNKRKAEITKEIIEQSLIVFDTNVLLNLYRFSYETSKNYFNLLDLINNQLWLPFLVALEYQFNRENVIRSKILAFSETKKAIQSSYDELIKKIKLLNLTNRHPSLNTNEITTDYKEKMNYYHEKIDELDRKSVV